MRIGVSLSELSGEHHVALLLERMRDELARHGEELSVFGLGSERLRRLGAELFEDIAEFSSIGIVSSMINMVRLLLKRRQTPRQLLDEFTSFILERKPDVVVLVDSRGMNLLVAKALRSKGYLGRIIYYVAPVRWEGCFDDEFFDKPGNLRRFEEMKDVIDFFFLIYPVSLEAYDKLNLPYSFIGHPMAEIARPACSRDEFAEKAQGDTPIPVGTRWMGLFPGSRWREIKAIAPTVIKAASILASKYNDIHFILPLAHEAFRGYIAGQLAANKLKKHCSIVGSELSVDAICHCRAIIAKSGTVLHIAALAGIPMVMVYNVSSLQRWLAETILDFGFPYYALPNIIAGREIVPEMIASKFNPYAVSVKASRLFIDGPRRTAMQSALAALRGKMVREDPLGTAAEKIIELVRKK